MDNSDNYVTRGELIRMLQAWQAGELATQQLWDWASHRFQAGGADYDDWDEGESAAREVLAMLDSLDLHFMLPEDVPMHLAFLQSPLGNFMESRETWRANLGGIDYDARKLALKHDPIYAMYC